MRVAPDAASSPETSWRLPPTMDHTLPYAAGPYDTRPVGWALYSALGEAGHTLHANGKATRRMPYICAIHHTTVWCCVYTTKRAS